jgi:hypothetical protein
MNNKFLNKVVGQILSETKLDYGVETVSPPFLSMSLFGFSFFSFHPFSIHNINSNPLSFSFSFKTHCREIYSLNDDEIGHVWTEFYNGVKDILQIDEKVIF